MAEHLWAELVIAALTMALQARRPGAGLIHRNDRGGQCTLLAFGGQIRVADLVASMGSVGNAYDNVGAEAFFSSLKIELIDRQT